MTATASLPAISPEPRVRLQFGGTQRTLLDGGWWPRSVDPVAELPNLVVAIDVVHGSITRLVLSNSSWELCPRRLAVNDRILRLAYVASQPAAFAHRPLRQRLNLSRARIPTQSFGLGLVGTLVCVLRSNGA